LVLIWQEIKQPVIFLAGCVFFSIAVVAAFAIKSSIIATAIMMVAFTFPAVAIHMVGRQRHSVNSQAGEPNKAQTQQRRTVLLVAALITAVVALFSVWGGNGAVALTFYFFAVTFLSLWSIPPGRASTNGDKLINGF
jgi:O-antigen/teichoic acid export membrane protein